MVLLDIFLDAVFVFNQTSNLKIKFDVFDFAWRPLVSEQNTMESLRRIASALWSYDNFMEQMASNDSMMEYSNPLLGHRGK